MKQHILNGLILILICLSGFSPASSGDSVQTPEAFFGFKPGADRQLIDYTQLIDYLKMLDAASPRLTLEEVGASPMGKIIYVAFISTPRNIENLQELKTVNRLLALESDLKDDEKKNLVKNGKVFLMVTLSMHSTEVGPSQMFPLYAHELVTTQNKAVLKQLSDVVLMIVPCHNPDGMDMIVTHYRKYKGTKYDGCGMPGVYHKYVGHDNNRDFVALTQSDTRVIARLYSREWYPQVLVEKHQMGSAGPRFYVPPPHDPIAEIIDEGLWDWVALFGANLARDMGEAGLKGVAHSWIFDNYWPGSTETSHWKNVISMLTENASCQLAKPVYIEPNELRVWGKGLSEYKKSVNMPAPWPGGWWRLSDIVEYELVSMRSLLRTASIYSRDILCYRNDICRKSVKLGRTRPPFYYILPRQQHDRSELVRLTKLLKEHGIRIFRLTEDAKLGRAVFQADDIVVPLAQPYRAFIKEVMENQRFPVRHYSPDGEMIRPYDITSWSLPLHRGVQAVEITEKTPSLEPILEEITEPDVYFSIKVDLPEHFWALAYPPTDNDSYLAAFKAMQAGLSVVRLVKNTDVENIHLPKGSLLILKGDMDASQMMSILTECVIPPMVLRQKMQMSAVPLSKRRIALVETYFHDMDAGWTRYVLDTYGVTYAVVRPGDFEKTDFVADFDVVVFPSSNKDVLLSGQYKRPGRYWIPDYPPEYTKGIGKKGMERLLAFIDQGGIIVAWGQSTELFMTPLEIKRNEKETEKFQLPIRNIASGLKKKGLSVPGSFLRINLNKNHPLALGMPEKAGVFFRGEPVFQTSIPKRDMDRRVIAVFPEENILASGFAEKKDLLSEKTVMVWLKKGKGQLVLMAFNPQFRASTQATYKLLFNALLLPEIQ